VGEGRGPEVIRDARGRRMLERDRHGTPVATLAWTAGDALGGASVRLPDGSWLDVAPRGAHDPRWGVSDLLCRGSERLTHCAAIDWARVAAIPPLAEPARLPAGAGTAVLNLLAALAADQGRGPLPYRGPYPTEQLFLSLLECFRWTDGTRPDDGPSCPPGASSAGGATEDVQGPREPLAAFMTGALRWWPAPHVRAFAPGGVYVQSRERIEKVVWGGRVYYRPDWQGVQRHAAHRVHDAADRVHASLWSLDAVLEEHLVLAADGTVLAAALPVLDDAPPHPVPAEVAAGLAAVVVAASAPPLAEWLRRVAAGVRFEWAPMSGDLAVLEGDRAILSGRLRRALATRVAATATRAEQVRLGFAALAELAHALGDRLRARAQAALAAAPPAGQAEALGRGRVPAEAAAGAREIGLAVERLLEDAAQLLA
jgi:hypothetical protein